MLVSYQTTEEGQTACVWSGRHEAVIGRSCPRDRRDSASNYSKITGVEVKDCSMIISLYQLLPTVHTRLIIQRTVGYLLIISINKTPSTQVPINLSCTSNIHITMKSLAVLLCFSATAAAATAQTENTTGGAIRAAATKTASSTAKNVPLPLPKKKERKVYSNKHNQMHQKALDRHLKAREGKSGATDFEKEATVETKKESAAERRLMKSKTGFTNSKLMWDNDGYGHRPMRDDDRPSPWRDDDGTST